MSRVATRVAVAIVVGVVVVAAVPRALGPAFVDGFTAFTGPLTPLAVGTGVLAVALVTYAAFALAETGP